LTTVIPLCRRVGHLGAAIAGRAVRGLSARDRLNETWGYVQRVRRRSATSNAVPSKIKEMLGGSGTGVTSAKVRPMRISSMAHSPVE
jgi:hypothetical protein